MRSERRIRAWRKETMKSLVKLLKKFHNEEITFEEYIKEQNRLVTICDTLNKVLEE